MPGAPPDARAGIGTATGAASGVGARCAPDGINLQSTSITDAGQQAALQSWVPMECYQLTGGGRVAQLDAIDLGPQRLVRERQEAAVQKLGASPKDLCTLSFSRTAITRFSEFQQDGERTIFFLPENTEFDVLVPAGLETAYVSFAQSDFLRAARILDPEGWENAPRGLAMLHTSQKAALWEAVDLWFRIAGGETATAPEADVLQTALFDTVLQVATAASVNTATDRAFSTARRAIHIGRAAHAFIDARLDADRLPTIIDICRELGVSKRTLHYAFGDYVGLSPVAYLRICRLNRVRAALAAADPLTTTVTEVAMLFGFLHLGRFPGDYKRMFGEMPSETLAS